MEGVPDLRQAIGRPQGHTILLFETKDGGKTYSDYPSLEAAINKTCELFEQYQLAKGGEIGECTAAALWEWMDTEFKKYNVLIFEESVSRYFIHDRNEYKELMWQRLQDVIADDADDGEEVAQEDDPMSELILD